MALYKELKTDSNVPITYHRIMGVDIMTNIADRIVVYSYISEEERQKELEYIELYNRYKRGEELTERELYIATHRPNIFIYQDEVLLEYNPEISIESAYEYLKTTERYEGAQDI